MRVIKHLLFLIAIAATQIVLADVPVVEGYQQGDSSSSQTDNSQANSDSSNSAVQVSGTDQPAPAAPSTASLPLDQRVTILEHQVNNMTPLLSQVNDLQQQIQDLRGKLDLADHNLQLLQNQVRSQYQDLDQRLPGGTAASITPSSAASSTTGTVTTAAATAASVGAASDDTASKPAANSNSDDSADADDNGDTSSSDQAATTAKNDTAAYQAAFNLLKDKKYTQAITAFTAFIKQYPTSANNVNAHYWLGQLYLLQGQPDNAITQFHTILTTAPTDPKVPDTSLQLALAYYAKGDLTQAKALLTKVQKKYPHSSAAKLAKTRLQEIDGQTSSSSANNTSAGGADDGDSN